MIEMPQSQPSLGSVGAPAPAEGASSDAPTGVFAELLSRNLGHQLVGRFQASGGDSGALSGDASAESEADPASELFPATGVDGIGPAVGSATPLPPPPVADRAAALTAEAAPPPAAATIEHVVSQLPPYSLDTSAAGPSVAPATTTATGAIVAVDSQHLFPAKSVLPAAEAAMPAAPGVAEGATSPQDTILPLTRARQAVAAAETASADTVPATPEEGPRMRSGDAPSSQGAIAPGPGSASPTVEGAARVDPVHPESVPMETAQQHDASGSLKTIQFTEANQAVEAVSGVAAPAPGAAASDAPASTPAQPVPSGLVDRVMQAVEMQRNQPPPRMVVVEVPELDGLRVMVAMQTDGKVHVTPLAGTAPVHISEPFVAAVADALTADGFQMADGSGNSDERRRSGDPASSENTNLKPRRSRRNGRRAGLRL